MFAAGNQSLILVLVGVPQGETASVLSINQIARSIGMSIGSALAGFLLTATTPNGAMLPAQNGYLTTALWALPPLAASALITATNRSPRRPTQASTS